MNRLGIFFIILVCLSACCFWAKPSHFAYYLEDGEKKLIPYQDGQDITFISNDGREFVFKIKETYTKVDNANLAPAEWCSPSTSSYDANKITFVPTFSDTTFTFPEIILFPGKVEGLGYFKGIRFSNGGLLSFGHDYSSERALLSAFSGPRPQGFFLLDYDQNYNLKESITSFHDTIRYVGSSVINGVNYDEIYELKENALDSIPYYQGYDDEALIDVIIWYTKTTGILRFSYKYTRHSHNAYQDRKLEFTLKP